MAGPARRASRKLLERMVEQWCMSQFSPVCCAVPTQPRVHMQVHPPTRRRRPHCGMCALGPRYRHHHRHVSTDRSPAPCAPCVCAQTTKSSAACTPQHPLWCIRSCSPQPVLRPQEVVRRQVVAHPLLSKCAVDPVTPHTPTLVNRLLGVCVHTAGKVGVRRSLLPATPISPHTVTPQER